MEATMIWSSRNAKLRPTQALSDRWLLFPKSTKKEKIRSHLPWTNRERIEGFLNIGLIAFKPPLGTKYFNTFTPYLLVPMNRIAWNANNSAFREVTVGNS